MFIQETQKIIKTFHERYISKYDSERGDYHEIHSYIGNTGIHFVCFYIEDYYLRAYFTDNEFHIENANGESIFNYANENNWSEEDIHFMKFG